MAGGSRGASPPHSPHAANRVSAAAGEEAMQSLLKRLGHAALMAAALVLYFLGEGDLVLLLALLVAPDLSLLGNLVGPRVGSIAYALLHFQVWPVAVALVGVLTGQALLVQVGLGWFAHTCMDRAIGLDLFPPQPARAAGNPKTEVSHVVA
jgi:hypothetical protein